MMKEKASPAKKTTLDLMRLMISSIFVKATTARKSEEIEAFLVCKRDISQRL